VLWQQVGGICILFQKSCDLFLWLRHLKLVSRLGSQIANSTFEPIVMFVKDVCVKFNLFLVFNMVLFHCDSVCHK
jgi:hypothetical protein